MVSNASVNTSILGAAGFASISRFANLAAMFALASRPLLAFDPLLDEPEPFAQWRVSKALSYTASSTPTWEAALWMGASKDVGVGDGSLNLDASMGLLYDDFQIDSGWYAQPKAAATWATGRLTVEGSGWGLWNDLGWADEGAGSDISWRLTDSAAADPVWNAGIHGWISENSGSAIGAKLSRISKGESWSTSTALTARRLWNIEVTQTRPGSARRTLSANATTDQWQGLFETGLDKNWKKVSAGIGMDLDVRASETDATTSRSPKGRGRMSSSSSNFLYTGTIDPYANISWTPSTWSLNASTGWSTEIQLGGGSIEPISTLWSSVSVDKSW